ncbi:hypothetical protein GCK72_021793 [Caenorhabditis remanei]|uniref:Uncharacterized protein n=1 Tax=Caenorhabditis remanei TaxID=31234 RepID=A0A6A5GKI8_CAERE|nr:hypothetical protein GCK72_021793 [Caenorhabditis remanei]KAF1755224.1 hypothetical protein GCK72_021793 [Caenorhabditis remanei]
MTIGCDPDPESVLLFLIPVTIKILGVIIIVLFLINYYSIPITQRTKSPFYDILGFYCVVLMSRTAFSTTVVLVLRLIDEFINRMDKFEESGIQFLLTQVCMYTDRIGDDFSMVMIFLMAFNRCLHFAAKDVSQRIFGK